MMSNCAFWSASGELTAVHGEGAPGPTDSFPAWAAAQRLPPGRLVPLSGAVAPVAAPGPGWHLVTPARPSGKRSRPPRSCDSGAPVAAFAPLLDAFAARLFPAKTVHERFNLSASPTWTATVRTAAGEGPEGWFAALAGAETSARFLVRLVPHRGRLPGEGWRNMLAWTLRNHHQIRLVPLNGLPSETALASAPAWEYRVEAGSGPDSAAWDVQLLPSRRLLSEWAPGTLDPWEATAVLRWVRPGAPAPVDLGPPARGELTWGELLGRLPVADARLLVQNVLLTLPGGAGSAASLFFEPRVLPSTPGGRELVRFVPEAGLPVAELSVLLGRRPWAEVERAKRTLPSEDERKAFRSEVLAEVDRRLAEGRLVWSPAAQDLWQGLYREPRHRALEAELAGWRTPDRWLPLLTGDPRRGEAVLRDLDVTDAALCLRDVPDTRWRRLVTARRETELRAELVFCQAWEARGELTVDRQLDAWRSWDEAVRYWKPPRDDSAKENYTGNHEH